MRQCLYNPSCISQSILLSLQVPLHLKLCVADILIEMSLCVATVRPKQFCIPNDNAEILFLVSQNEGVLSARSFLHLSFPQHPICC